MDASWAAEVLRIDRALRQQLCGLRLLVGNPSPAYATVLRSSLLRTEAEPPPPELLGVAATVAELRQLWPDPATDVLVATTSHLQDGCCVPLLAELVRCPEPPLVLVMLPVEAPPLPLAPLLDWSGLAIVWEGNVGKGMLLQAIEVLRQGQRFLDPDALQRIQEAQAIAGLLTEREREVLTLVAQGLTNRQIAQRLVVAEVTARDHVQRILRKLEVPDRAAAAGMALRLGLVI